MADDEQGMTTGGRFETFDANRWFVVVRDDDGYGVWRLDDLDEDEPIERFSDDDDGYEAAAARWKTLTKQAQRESGVWLDRLRVVVLVALGLWVVASAVPALEFLLEEDAAGVSFPGDPGTPLWERILYAVSTLAFDVWIAASIAYLVLWMDRRRPST